MIWQDNAACKGQPVTLFVGAHNMRPARKFCEACPVRSECLEFALADPDLMGLWGGTVEAEREAIRRGRRPENATRSQVESLLGDGQWHPLSWVISARGADRRVRKARASWMRMRVQSGDLEVMTLSEGTRMIRMAARARREAA